MKLAEKLPTADSLLVDTATSMAAFDGGWFEMGASDGAPAEQPIHRRYVAPFAIDRDLVTNADFDRFVEATGYVSTCEGLGSAWGFDGEAFGEIAGLHWRSYATENRQNHPVVLVSWDDANAYAVWAGKRLPSEAEWEFAAQLAAQGNKFPWAGNGEAFDNCGAGSEWRDGPGTSAVGSFGSAIGVHDLVGNVWQWCADPYDADAYTRAANGDVAQRDSADGLRVRRGGAWNVMQAFRLRCSNRGAYMQERSAPNIGFRCAITLDRD